jgi:rhodanese-related sulfurtransferase
MIATITPQELDSRRQAGQPVELIDVRTPAEFQEVHVPFARNVPLERFDPQSVRVQRGGGTLYVICRSGSRGKQACERLVAAGLDDVVNVEGGTLAWDAAGLPVVRGQKAISLERQVRIAAGTLVLIGAALGFFVHPAWIGLAAFVGAGLVFAGVTDTCGMALLLARMPWNQVAGPCADKSAAPASSAKASETKTTTSCCG